MYDVIQVIRFSIVMGAEYIYTNDIPAGRAGHRYRAEELIVDVPSYQEKVFVRCLSGPDAGRGFTVTPDNFSRRYRRVEEST